MVSGGHGCGRTQVVKGGNNLTAGPATAARKEEVMAKVATQGFAHKPQVRLVQAPPPLLTH